MREQNREQSRERSRRSILQSAIAIANARGTPIAAVSAATVAGGFLNQHHRFDCVSAASVPMPGPAGMAVHRAQTEPPWYQTAHRPKPVHSPRIGDWYGGVDGDPIERLQAMGAMHQQQQQQQRGLDKPPSVVKEQRNQECAATAAFSSNGHSPDFAAAERELRRQETAADYADFVDGQKWHPYQVIERSAYDDDVVTRGTGHAIVIVEGSVDRDVHIARVNSTSENYGFQIVRSPPHLSFVTDEVDNILNAVYRIRTRCVSAVYTRGATRTLALVYHAFAKIA